MLLLAVVRFDYALAKRLKVPQGMLWEVRRPCELFLRVRDHDDSLTVRKRDPTPWSKALEDGSDGGDPQLAPISQRRSAACFSCHIFGRAAWVLG